MNCATWIYIGWTVMVTIWIISSFGNKKSKQKEPAQFRYLTLALYIIGAVLLFSNDLQFGNKIYPQDTIFRIIGFVACYVGLIFAIWARWVLGKNWSGRISIKKEQDLIAFGPYRITRNPIYSGLLLAFLGTAFAFGHINDYIGFLFFLIGIVMKLKREEKIMRENFGVRFNKYAQKVKYRLIPFIY